MRRTLCRGHAEHSVADGDIPISHLSHCEQSAPSKLRWGAGHAGNADFSALQMDEEENVIGCQTFPGEHLDGKEVDSDKHIHVRVDEVLPGGDLAPFRSRCNAVSAQGVAHGLIGNNVVQVSHCADDAVITSARVFFRHLHDQIGDLTADPRPTGVGAKLGAVELLGYEAAIPGENRVRLCHAGDVFQRLAAEPLADLSECGSLWIRQAQSRR